MPPKRVDPHRETRLRHISCNLGHAFKNLELLDRALSHSSLGNDGVANYERLEFLGDAVLGFLVAESLYRRKPEIPEGELTTRRSLLVSRRPLSIVAEHLDLASYLRVGRGLTEDAIRSQRILADLVEAVLGAIYLDGGIRAARKFVQTHIIERFKEDQESYHETTDPKTRLNQWAQSHDLGTPDYAVVETTGPDHDPTFLVSVTLDGMTSYSNQVKSKQTGEQEAAARCFDDLMERRRESLDDEPEDAPPTPRRPRAKKRRASPRHRDSKPSRDNEQDEIQLIWDEPG